MKRIFSTLSGRVISTLILGIAVTSVLIISVLTRLSENIYVETYGKSQEKVFAQVINNLETRYENVYEVLRNIEESWSFNTMFNPKYKIENGDERKMFNNVYQFQKDMSNIINTGIDNQKVMIVGENGNTFMYNGDIVICSAEDILSDECTDIARKEPDVVHYVLRQGGFTQSTRDSSLIVAVKACTDDEGQPFAYVYITYTEDEMEENYDFFCASNTDFYMVDLNGKIITSNKKNMLGKEYMYEAASEADYGIDRKSYNTVGNKITILSARLKYSSFKVYGVINNNEALKEFRMAKPVIAMCIVITLIIAAITTLIIRKSMYPLKLMADKMSHITKNEADDYMPVRGTEEMQIMAKRYNDMLDDINLYIEAVNSAQNQKRRAEIKALQMQINPHYVYNTLASIKWLIWSREVDKSIKTIDAFIALLRNTISNTDEYVTVRQEKNNILNYMWINSIRYGDRIKTDFFVMPECDDYILPKMILQPFVENAFFHAFPNNESGMVQIYVRIVEDMLQIEIIDDGVGMSKDIVKNVKTDKHYDNYSGIGINNVSERLKLLYGEKQSMEITSIPGKGTTIRIRIKAEKADESK